ncbi:ferritin-like domain-containing protein [Nostoc sp. ChiVER01]|uniref:ferritin-like domain-containing protein n=1 Tax=Nostoc sp. ChiVER01 TaxID=3075382 RepID=UPI002AD4AAB9|nr:ferritin-like domain-containing protein [Nostoc sp. ChiVER01]MDZ8221811.1 ferritin-like domain-containing protein [Nostoc sp. ChiVER01]
MKIGSKEHKELFCRSFIESHLEYEPAHLPWPTLDSVTLESLRNIPFWREALNTEQEAGVMVNAFAATISDPLLKDAIALQGMEEVRHGRLMKFLIDRYDIQISPPPAPVLPSNIKTAFLDFGFGECLDSFLAFGLFGLARRHVNYIPEALFDIFDKVLDEEARHIMFFINWVTYLQIQEGKSNWLRGINALIHYSRALKDKITAFSGSNEEQQEGFTATGASNFIDNLTPELLLSTCLKENSRRLGVFDKELLQPQLVPNLAKMALATLRLLPRRQSRSLAQLSEP